MTVTNEAALSVLGKLKLAHSMVPRNVWNNIYDAFYKSRLFYLSVVHIYCTVSKPFQCANMKFGPIFRIFGLVLLTILEVSAVNVNPPQKLWDLWFAVDVNHVIIPFYVLIERKIVKLCGVMLCISM